MSATDELVRTSLLDPASPTMAPCSSLCQGVDNDDVTPDDLRQRPSGPSVSATERRPSIHVKEIPRNEDSPPQVGTTGPVPG